MTTFYLMSNDESQRNRAIQVADGFLWKYELEKELNSVDVKGKNLMVVDDGDYGSSNYVKDIFESEKMRRKLGYNEFTYFYSPGTAIQKFPEIKPDVVISDIRMPGISGFELIESMRKSEAAK